MCADKNMKIMRSFPAGCHTALLCLGSNLGEREALIKRAEELIDKKCGPVTGRSGIYETQAWGSDSRLAYLNQVLEIRTSLTPAGLLNELLGIERELGRERTGDRNADRLIDIDILFFNNLVTEEMELVIPHPRLHERRFVLVPLGEIAPGFIHPVFNKSVRSLLSECPDALAVNPYRPGG